jgi:hypothetical protein
MLPMLTKLGLRLFWKNRLSTEDFDSSMPREIFGHTEEEAAGEKILT